MRTTGKTPPASDEITGPLMGGLLEWCGRIGNDPRMVQGGGGNVSVKCGEIMSVKASGWTFSSLCHPEGFAVLRHAPIAALFTGNRLYRKPSEKKYAEGLEANLQKGSPRPSIESAMHALLGDVVCHTHPSPLLRVLCRRGARARIDRLMRGIGAPWMVVPYANPGASLAAAVVRSAREAGINLKAQLLVLFLRNHGLVTVGGTPDEAFALTRRIVTGVEAGPGEHPDNTTGRSAGRDVPSITNALIPALDGLTVGEGRWRVADTKLAEAICGAVLSGVLPADRSLFPDQAVYCGQAVLVLKSRSRKAWDVAWDEYVCSRGAAPLTVMHRDGVLAFRSSSDRQFRAQSETWGCVSEICEDGDGELIFIPKSDVLALTGCKMERNRLRYIMSKEAAMAFQRR